MHYHGPVIRPQTDSRDIFIELTIGCTYDGCTFCNFYDGFPFRMAKWEDIEEDFQEAALVRRNARKLWASGGNPIALHMKHLRRFAELKDKYLPGIEIATYARVDDLQRKSVEDFKELKALGYTDIVIGVESFDDEVLAHVNKGYSVADIRDGLGRLEAAGLAYRVIYLGGLAGAGKAEITARRSAEVMNEFHPVQVLLTTVSVLRGTKLFGELERGEFKEMSEKERVVEFRELIANLKNPIEVFAETATTSVSFTVSLPDDKLLILHQLDKAIAQFTPEREQELQRYRHAMRSV